MFRDPPEHRPLVVVGSINADLVIEVPRLPQPGETLSGGNLSVYPGGKASERERDEASFVGLSFSLFKPSDHCFL